MNQFVRDPELDLELYKQQRAYRILSLSLNDKIPNFNLFFKEEHLA